MPHSASSRIASRAVSPTSAGSGSTMSAGSASGAATRGSPRCAGGANVASSGAIDRVEGDRFADQRYLDRLPELFKNVHVIGHLGANLAPWNLEDLRVEWRDGSVRIEDRYRLLFFHFYGVRRRGRHYFNSHRVYRAPFTDVMRHHIYEPYTSVLCKSEDAGRALSGGGAHRDHSPAFRRRTARPLDERAALHAGDAQSWPRHAHRSDDYRSEARDTLISLHPAGRPVQCAC